MKGETNNKRQAKLLAAVAVMAMVVCALAVAMPAEEADGAVITTPTEVEVVENSTPISATNGVTYYVPANITANITAPATTAGASVILASGATANINGGSQSITVYVAQSFTSETSKATYENGTKLVVKAATTGAVTVTGTYDATSKVTTISAETGVANGTSTILEADKTGTDSVNIRLTGEMSTALTGASQTLGIANATTTYSEPVTVTQAPTTATVVTLVGNVIADIEIVEKSAGAAANDAASVDTSTFTLTGKISYGNMYVSGTGMVIKVTATNLDADDTLVMNTFNAGSGFAMNGVTGITALAPAGNLDITGLDLDGITNVNPTGTVTGSVTINGCEFNMSGFKGTIGDDGGTTKITTITAGTLSLVSGVYSVANTFSIAAGSTLNILEDATLSLNGINNSKLTLGSVVTGAETVTINQYGIITSRAANSLGTAAANDVTIEVIENGRFIALRGAALQQVSVVEKGGVVNTSGAMEDLIIESGTLNSSAPYSQYQNVIINVSMTIQRPAEVVILGKLTVNPGVTLYVAEGATLTIGDAAGITADLDVQGTLDVSGDLAIYSEEMKVTNGGTIVIESTGSLEILAGKMTVGASSSLEIGGDIAMAENMAIYNQGIVRFTEATVQAVNTDDKTVTIQQVANGATVEIDSVTGGVAGASIVITDSSIDDAAYNTRVQTSSDNALTISLATTYTVSGVTVTETVTSETVGKNTVYTSNMVLSGNLIAQLTAGGDLGAVTDIATIAGGSIIVDDEFNLGTNVKASVTGDLHVSGTMNLVTGSVLYGNGEVTVTGTIVKPSTTLYDSNGTAGLNNLNAVEYRVINNGAFTYYYTGFAAAVQAGQSTVTVYGDVTVTETVDVPSTVTVINNGTITIDDDVTVTVPTGGKIRGGAIYVDGTLEVQNSNDVTSRIVSDVVAVSGSSATYTNVYNALAGADEGSTVVISKSPEAVAIDRDLTIPAGVTLQVDAAKYLLVSDNVTVTVNGTLFLNGGAINPVTAFEAEADDEASEIAVNGMIKSLNPVVYATGFEVAGAYYSYVDSTGNFNYISPLAIAAPHIQDAQVIGVYGNNTVGDVTITGTPNGTDSIVVYGQLEADTITMSDTILDIEADAQFDGTVASAAGSVEVINVKNLTIQASVDGEEPALYMEGTPGKADATEGTPAAEITVISGDALVVDALDATNVTFAVNSGSTVTVNGAAGKLTLGTMTVNGTLAAVDGGSITATTLTILGTLDVGVATADEAAGSVKAVNLYVGIDDEFKTQASAVVNGSVANVTTAFVYSGATVSDDMISIVKCVEFYVENELWITGYSNTSVTAPYKTMKENVFLEKWYDEDGTEYDKNEGIPTGTPKKVYADIEYNVYSVTVYADPGVDAVYIDGNLMVGAGMYHNLNAFKLDVAAGDHTITYKLKNGYSGEATITVNGDKDSDLTFTTSGTPDPTGTGSISYEIVIQGIEKSGYETPAADDGMGLTDYLLIILVVLIVVMAVMVALRLMRS